MSIAYNGFFDHEPLLVEKVGKGKTTSATKYVVIEGNRRFAAVLALLDPDLRAELKLDDLPPLTRARRDALSSLPVIVTTREEQWRYLGFKHVNGPATWGSYAKAQYIAQVHRDYGVPIEDIARQIGDYSSSAERMFRGLMVIEQAENERIFSRARTAKKKFYFNFIYSALDNANCRAFLGLDGVARDRARPVPKAKLAHLRELLTWLYGDGPASIEPVIERQNPDLNILLRVIGDERGLDALRGGAPLSVANDAAEGDTRLFQKGISDAKKALQAALGTLPTGFGKGDTSSLLGLARDVERLSRDLVDAMEEKVRRRKRPEHRK